MPQALFHQYGAIRELERSMSVLYRYGLGKGTGPYDALFRARTNIWKSIGIKQFRLTTLVRMLFGLSPGSIKVWHDAESGFFTEARARPGAPPVYRAVSDEVAVTIVKGELTHKLEEELLTPDEYLGE